MRRQAACPDNPFSHTGKDGKKLRVESSGTPPEPSTLNLFQNPHLDTLGRRGAKAEKAIHTKGCDNFLIFGYLFQ